jgi:hypothetical protein
MITCFLGLDRAVPRHHGDQVHPFHGDPCLAPQGMLPRVTRVLCSALQYSAVRCVTQRYSLPPHDRAAACAAAAQPRPLQAEGCDVLPRRRGPCPVHVSALRRRHVCAATCSLMPLRPHIIRRVRLRHNLATSAPRPGHICPGPLGIGAQALRHGRRPRHSAQRVRRHHRRHCDLAAAARRQVKTQNASATWQRVAACCSVLQRVALVCCSVSQRVAACCSVLQRVAACCSETVQRGAQRTAPAVACGAAQRHVALAVWKRCAAETDRRRPRMHARIGAAGPTVFGPTPFAAVRF